MIKGCEAWGKVFCETVKTVGIGQTLVKLHKTELCTSMIMVDQGLSVMSDAVSLKTNICWSAWQI